MSLVKAIKFCTNLNKASHFCTLISNANYMLLIDQLSGRGKDTLPVYCVKSHWKFYGYLCKKGHNSKTKSSNSIIFWSLIVNIIRYSCKKCNHESDKYFNYVFLTWGTFILTHALCIEASLWSIYRIHLHATMHVELSHTREE